MNKYFLFKKSNFIIFLLRNNNKFKIYEIILNINLNQNK